MRTIIGCKSETSFGCACCIKIDKPRRTQVYHDPTNADIAPPIPVLDKYLQTPVPQYTLLYGDTVGGKGGPSMTYDTVFTEIELGKIVTQIVLQGSELHIGFMNLPIGKLNAMTISYAYKNSDAKPPQEHSYGTPEKDNTMVPKMTIPLGVTGNIITGLSSSQYINENDSVNGCVSRLKVNTTAQPDGYVYPPDGITALNAWPFPPNSALIGFGVSSNTFINAMCPIFASFKPCLWGDSELLQRKNKRLQQKPFPAVGATAAPTMLGAMPSPTHLLEDIMYLLSSNYDKIQELALQRGGWERWLQCELAYYFRAKYRTVRAFREIQTFEETLKYFADIVFMPPDDNTTDRKQIIELKCEYTGSMTAAAAINNFWKQFINVDMAQCASHLEYVTEDFLPCSVW